MAIKAPEGPLALQRAHHRPDGRAGHHRPVGDRGGRDFVHVPDENHRVLKPHNRVDWQREILDRTGRYTAE